VSRGRVTRLGFRVRRAFEYLESDGFESFLARPLESRLEDAGLEVLRVEDVGGYRIWLCVTATARAAPEVAPRAPAASP
jgi:hypothetical protein